MTLTTLLYWWGLFAISNVLVGAAVGMLVKGGPFAKVRVSPMVSTFLFICGLTLLLVSGKQNLLQSTITFITGG